MTAGPETPLIETAMRFLGSALIIGGGGVAQGHPHGVIKQYQTAHFRTLLRTAKAHCQTDNCADVLVTVTVKHRHETRPLEARKCLLMTNLSS